MPLTINGLDELYNDMTAMAGAVGNESHVMAVQTATTEALSEFPMKPTATEATND